MPVKKLLPPKAFRAGSPFARPCYDTRVKDAGDSDAVSLARVSLQSFKPTPRPRRYAPVQPREMTMMRQLVPIVALSFGAAVAAYAQQPVTADAPKTVVSTVRLENGLRASKLIGAAVYNAQNEHIGDVSDLYLSKQNQIANVVIQVGGFLGIGGKLVSVPMDKLQLDQPDKVIMPDGSKEALKAAPGVEYAG
jgi:sporulation protein YlmC with PRC-barrel domain